MSVYYLNTPLRDEDVASLTVNDTVYLSGKIYTARDMAHYKLKNILDHQEKFNEDLRGAAIFHAGPIVKYDDVKHEYLISSIGPTSSIRMEPYSEMVGGLGIKVLIGKGGMGPATADAMQRYKMVYLLAAHGCAAIHTQKITKIYRQYWLDEIGMPEALWVMECLNFGPLVVGIDSTGRNLFEEIKVYAKNKIEAGYC